MGKLRLIEVKEFAQDHMLAVIGVEFEHSSAQPQSSCFLLHRATSEGHSYYHYKSLEFTSLSFTYSEAELVITIFRYLNVFSWALCKVFFFSPCLTLDFLIS